LIFVGSITGTITFAGKYVHVSCRPLKVGFGDTISDNTRNKRLVMELKLRTYYFRLWKRSYNIILKIAFKSIHFQRGK
jgi:hypothetical protein